MGDEKDEGVKPWMEWQAKWAQEMKEELERRGMLLGAVPTMAIIKARQIFVLTSGEYSDYRLDGIFRALKDIDPEDKERWPAELSTAAKLVREGFAEELTFTEWH